MSIASVTCTYVDKYVVSTSDLSPTGVNTRQLNYRTSVSHAVHIQRVTE